MFCLKVYIMPISFDVLRTGKKYRLTNYGEKFEFKIMKINTEDFLVKDLNSLEEYYLIDLIRYGKGADYDLEELE